MRPEALLRAAVARGLDAIDARVLLCHATGLRHAALLARDTVTPEQIDVFDALVARRLAGEPVAYLTGAREFHGLAFDVTPAVLIPRPDTELLVDLALARLPTRSAPLVLDLGTGSGAVAVAIAAARPDAEVVATDASEAALAVARTNAARLLPAARAPRFLHGDWFAALGAESPRFDLIVSNPPYIAAGDPHLGQGDLRFEPRGALTDGADGLSALRAIVAGAPAHLVDDGWLLLEHGYDQGAAVRALFDPADWTALTTARDLGGQERVTAGRRMAAPANRKLG